MSRTWRGVSHPGPRDWSAQTDGGGVRCFCGLCAPSEPEVIPTTEQCVSPEMGYKSLHARISRSSRSPASSLCCLIETMMNCSYLLILQVRLLCVFLLVMSRLPQDLIIRDCLILAILFTWLVPKQFSNRLLNVAHWM